MKKYIIDEAIYRYDDEDCAMCGGVINNYNRCTNYEAKLQPWYHPLSQSYNRMSRPILEKERHFTIKRSGKFGFYDTKRVDDRKYVYGKYNDHSPQIDDREGHWEYFDEPIERFGIDYNRMFNEGVEIEV